MEKLPMCRICLVENVNMYVVVNKNMHELYEKLTDIPFVTKDSRPILACFFCCAKLKQCFRFLRKCLEAEELFAQMMNGDYEPNPSISQDDLHCCTGFIKSPTVHISIVDECETDSIGIKEEVPAICERQDDVIEPNEEYQSDDVDLENLNNTCLGTENIPPHLSETDSGGDVKIEEEQKLTEKKRRAVETNSAPLAAKKPKLDVQKEKNETSVSPKRTKKGQEQIKNTGNTKPTTKRTPKTIIKSTKNITNKNSTKTSPVPNNTTCNIEKLNIQEMKRKENTASFQCNNVKDEFKCLCNDNGINSSDIKRHSLRHNCLCDKDRPYKCDICKRSFSEKGNLKDHIHTHTGEKPFKCDICQSSFCQSSPLKRHIRAHTGEKPYTCDICQSSFSQNSVLKTHIRTHTGEKPYTCDICQSSFSQLGHLKIHIRTHTGEKPYNCDTCKRSFSGKHNLKNHIRTHTGERPFKCDICKCSFSEKGNLKKHIRTHTGEKPYTCDTCQRRFSENHSLKNHLRTHTGEKPFKCDICKISFSRKDNLYDHIRTHTGEKPYKCVICPMNFSHPSSLKYHVLKYHK